MRVKPISDIVAKWSSKANAAGQDYQKGIERAGDTQAQAAEAAAPVWAAAIQMAIQNNRFAKGLMRVGSEKWKRNAIAKGVNRYGPGITAAAPDFAKGVAPSLEVLANLNLPPKGPKGDPANYNRVQLIGQALRARKLSG